MPQGHYRRDQEREPVRFGILLPTRRLVMEGGRPGQFKEIVSLAQTAEQAGLDSVWVGDSLTAKPRLEPLSTLTAVAMETERVRLGTAVLLPALRYPVHLAHQAATVDFISDGRLILGAGVGGAFNEAQRTEWSHAGVNLRTRASRFEEVVEIVKRLTSGETLDFDGEHFSLEGASIAPKSPQDGGVPFLIASHWRAGQRRHSSPAPLAWEVGSSPYPTIQMSTRKSWVESNTTPCCCPGTPRKSRRHSI